MNGKIKGLLLKVLAISLAFAIAIPAVSFAGIATTEADTMTADATKEKTLKLW